MMQVRNKDIQTMEKHLRSFHDFESKCNWLCVASRIKKKELSLCHWNILIIQACLFECVKCKNMIKYRYVIILIIISYCILCSSL